MQRNRRKQQNGKDSEKIGSIKGTFHARMGMIKDRTNKEITEAEGIKEKWQEYTEELYKKIS